MCLRKDLSFKELEGPGLSRRATRPDGRDFTAAVVADRASGSEVIGFVARLICEDDSMEAKYINTPETVLYKKSSVFVRAATLPSGDIARAIAVVVEGYTDVIACTSPGCTRLRLVRHRVRR